MAQVSPDHSSKSQIFEQEALPSYEESMKNYKAPPTYSQVPSASESNEIYEMLDNVVSNTDFHSIDNFDFSCLDTVVANIDWDAPARPT